jgi:hypothetical protein
MDVLIPPSLKSLKPGEISLVILGRVVMGDIAITLVDLARQDLLRVEETDDGADWRLTPSHCVSARQAPARQARSTILGMAPAAGRRYPRCMRERLVAL